MVQNVYFGMYGSYFALNMLAVVHNIVFLIHINTALSLSHRIYSDSRIVSSHESNNNNKIIIIICVYYDMTVAHQYSTLKNEKLHIISYTVQTMSTQSYTQSYIAVQFNIWMCQYMSKRRQANTELYLAKETSMDWTCFETRPTSAWNYWRQNER